MEFYFNCLSSDERSLIDEDDGERDGDEVPTRPASSTKAGPAGSSNSSADEMKTNSAPPVIQDYPPPPPPASLLASIGNSLSHSQMTEAAPGLAYPRPIHPAWMLEAMNFHHRMMPDGRPTYASFLSGQHHLLPRYVTP